MSKKPFPLNRSDSEWKKELEDDRYHVLREKGTEQPFSGAYNLHFEDGEYSCGACHVPLFKSKNKFDSGCGWPSFDDAIKGSVTYILDKNHGMMRTEIVCSNCGSHLGHLFNDGPTNTGQRYCINSLSLGFKK